MIKCLELQPSGCGPYSDCNGDVTYKSFDWENDTTIDCVLWRQGACGGQFEIEKTWRHE